MNGGLLPTTHRMPLVRILRMVWDLVFTPSEDHDEAAQPGLGTVTVNAVWTALRKRASGEPGDKSVGLFGMLQTSGAKRLGPRTCMAKWIGPTKLKNL